MLKILIKEDSKFDWKIFVRKLIVNSSIALVTGLIVMWQEDPIYVVLIPALQALLNYLKHR